MTPMKMLAGAIAGLSLVIFSAPTVAQQERDVIELVRAQVATNRQALVAENLGLTAEQSEVFWPMYRKFQNERAALVDRRVQILTDFRDNYGSLSNEKARQLLDDYLKYAQDMDKLTRKYVREFRKILDDKMVLRYMQIEGKIDTIIDYDLAQVVPLAE